MPHTATQATSQEKSVKNRLDQARMQGTANNAFHDQKVAPIPQAKKSPIKQPQEVTSPVQAQSRAQDLKIQQRAPNTPQQQANTPVQDTKQGVSDKQNIKQQQKTSQKQRRSSKFTLSPHKKIKIRKYEKVIAKYEKTSFFLPYSVAIAADTLDIINAALAPVPVVNFITIPLFTIIGWSLRLYLSIFIWTHSSRISRAIARISLIMILDMIPLLSILPVTVLIIYRLDKKMEESADEAREELKKLTS